MYSRNSTADKFGYTPKSWGKYPSTARKLLGDLTMSWPFQVTEPFVGLVMVARMRIRVDLPAPLGPSRPSTPGAISSVKSRKPQFFLLYCLLTFWMLITIGGNCAIGRAVRVGVVISVVIFLNPFYLCVCSAYVVKELKCTWHYTEYCPSSCANSTVVPIRLSKQCAIMPM